MIRYVASLVFCFLVCAPALAQYDDWSIWESELETGLGLVLAPDADQSALFRLYASGSVDRVFDNGLEAGVAGRVEIQRDHTGRAGFTGVPLGFEGNGSMQVGAFSGLATGVPQNHANTRIQLEEAYLYFEGGYGQLRIGRDEGIAGRFQRDVPSVFRAARLGDAQLDPTGRDIHNDGSRPDRPCRKDQLCQSAHNRFTRRGFVHPVSRCAGPRPRSTEPGFGSRARLYRQCGGSLAQLFTSLSGARRASSRRHSLQPS